MLLGLAECKPKIHSGNNNNNLKRVFPRTMSAGSLTMTCQNIKGYLLGKTVTTTKHENDSHLFRILSFAFIFIKRREDFSPI